MVDISAIKVYKVNSIGNVTAHLNPFTVNRDNSRFKSVLRADQIPVYWELKCVFKHQDFQLFGLKLNKYQ